MCSNAELGRRLDETTAALKENTEAQIKTQGHLIEIRTEFRTWKATVCQPHADQLKELGDAVAATGRVARAAATRTAILMSLLLLIVGPIVGLVVRHLSQTGG